MGVQSSLMSCRREHSEYSFRSADKDISNSSYSLTPNECFTSPVITARVCPTCPWRCFLQCSTCLWAAAEVSSSMCSWRHRWADSCLRGNQAAQLLLLSHWDFVCGEKINHIFSLSLSFLFCLFVFLLLLLLLSILRRRTLVYIYSIENSASSMLCIESSPLQWASCASQSKDLGVGLSGCSVGVR